MLTDGGSIPPASTKFKYNKDPSRPTKAYTNQRLSGLSRNQPLVSDGLIRPIKWHKFDTNLPPAAKADELTAEYGTAECRNKRKQIFSDLSPIAIDLALRYVRTIKRYHYDQAQQELQDIHSQLKIKDLNLCADLKVLYQVAKRCAEKCRSLSQAANTQKIAFEHCRSIVESYQIKSPEFENDYQPLINRMCCEKWWFRKIKILRLKKIEAISRNIELVSRNRAIYAVIM